jgi:hypothetical protein
MAVENMKFVLEELSLTYSRKPTGGPIPENQLVPLFQKTNWWPYSRKPTGDPIPENQLVALFQKTNWWPYNKFTLCLLKIKCDYVLQEVPVVAV